MDNLLLYITAIGYDNPYKFNLTIAICSKMLNDDQRPAISINNNFFLIMSVTFSICLQLLTVVRFPWCSNLTDILSEAIVYFIGQYIFTFGQS